MDELPAPLSAPDCYLGGYEFMPLLGTRLFGSRFYGLALKNPRAGLAAMKLWWLAYSEQKPAGSLPDNDDDLCRMADLGTDLRAWARVKSVALHGFVRCSDGRYYHPVICDEAATAFAARIKERIRKADWRAAKSAQPVENTEDTDPGPKECPAGQDGDKTGTSQSRHADGDGDATRMSPLTGQDRTGQKERKKDSEASPLPSEPAQEPSVSAREMLWRDGLPIIQHLTGKPETGCRQLLGKLLRDARDDAARVLLVLREAHALQPADPVAWLSKAITPPAQQSERPKIRNGFLAMIATDGFAERERSEQSLLPRLSNARH